MKKILMKIKNIDLKKIILNLKENYILEVYFVLSCLINATILRIVTVKNVFNVIPFFIDLGFMLIITSFSFFKKRKNRFRYFMVFSIILTAICIINSLYYTYYSSFASVSLLATSVFVVDVGDAVVENVLQVKDFIFLWQPILLIVIYIYLKKKSYFDKVITKSKKELVKKTALSGALIMLIASIFISPTGWGRFFKLWNRESVVINFGVYTYQVNDVVQSLKPQLNNIFGHDNALKKVKDFYEENPYESIENEYTNIFKGYNVIVIHAESIQEIAMELEFEGKQVTPNLNKLASEGIFFSNYYSEVGVGTSSDAEFTFNTSLMPSSNGTVFVNYFDRKFITTPKLLTEKGYYTFSMHGNTGDFWNRNIMHKNMGYQMFYHKDYYNIDEEIGLGLSDKSFFRQSTEIISNVVNEQQKPFYATLIMLTNHTPFSHVETMDEFNTTLTVEINGEKITRDYINGTTLGNYFRSVHYADQAIGEFIEELDEKGLLDNTIIVIYGDHDARIDKNYYDILYNYDPISDKILTKDDNGYIDYNEYEYELDRKVPFIIWTKDKQFNLEVTTAMGMIDALPKLGNMLNIHSNYQLGTDIFNVTDNTVVFTDGSYLTNEIYYNSQKDEIYPISGRAVDQNYITSRSQYANKIIEISNDIISYDLIKEILGR